ncbi:MAG: hypothetical protein HY692_06610, partial [Cyanobacteria bacterium NC_groundwater_1444_Ag_S-0.65um_54_12]|nr:hypothetical protein [Cyanobacteria bacterium NC_groundwater_1444_Ag_S-0.65um_54_12]
MAIARSEIGKAVVRAVWRTRGGTIPVEQIFRPGRLAEVWINKVEPHNYAIAQLCREIAKARHEIRMHVYAIDTGSEAWQQVYNALVKKQRELPDFKIFIVYRGDYFPYYTRLKEHLAASG